MADREGAYPVASPAAFTRFTFNGGVQVLGIPLRVDALYSTEQNYVPPLTDTRQTPIRQPMNRISVSLDVQQLQQMLRSRINAQIAQLEAASGSDGLKNIEKLYQLESLGGKGILGERDLENYLRKNALYDSLRGVAQGLPGRARRQVMAKQDSIYGVILSRKDGWSHQLADALNGGKGKLPARVREYLDREHLAVNQLQKRLYRVDYTPNGPLLTPVSDNTILKPGDLLRIRIELRSDRAMEFVHMKDMRAAGLEPVEVLSGPRHQDGLSYYQSNRDAATNFFFSYLPKGTFVFEYNLRVTHQGNFSNGITTIQCMYAPEFSAQSEGIKLEIK